MFATWSTVPDSASIDPGCADADPGEPHRLDAGVVERRAQRLGELEGNRLRAAFAGRLPSRAAEHRRLAVRDDRLDLRAAEVEPALHPRHDSHRTTSSIGLRFARALHSSVAVQLRVARALGQAEREDDHRHLVVARLEHARARSASVIPFGQDAIPSAQAASSML